MNHLTYLYLLTPLHVGGSSNEGNMMGIAREVHTEFPYLPSSSLRGRIRSELEQQHPEEAKVFFGHKIENGQQPTEGEVWFADATLLFFPIASLSHHLVWITCPLWLERWNRWLDGSPLKGLVKTARTALITGKQEKIKAVVTFNASKIYLQTALLQSEDIEILENSQVEILNQQISNLVAEEGIICQLTGKLIILTDEDCIALVETGLQREVRVTLENKSKTVKGGSFRSEEAIPPETVLFFPWGMKPAKKPNQTAKIRGATTTILNERLQFGGLEGLGKGWSELTTVQLSKEINDETRFTSI